MGLFTAQLWSVVCSMDIYTIYTIATIDKNRKLKENRVIRTEGIGKSYVRRICGQTGPYKCMVVFVGVTERG